MVFVLCARDPSAPMTVRYWCNLRVSAGFNKPDDAKIIEALAAADAMEQWSLVQTKRDVNKRDSNLGRTPTFPEVQ